MEFLFIFEKVSMALDTYEKLKSFTEIEMVKVLKELGDVEYGSAIRALEDAKKSRNPTREIDSAITNLRTAYQAFISAANKTKFFGLVGPGADEIAEAQRKACASALLIATGYKRLREDDLKNSYKSKAITAFNAYAEASFNAAKASDWLQLQLSKGPDAPPIANIRDGAAMEASEERNKKRIAAERKAFTATCNKL